MPGGCGKLSGMTEPSPPWSRETKRLVVLIALGLVALGVVRFPIVIRPLLLGLLLAYLLNPLAERIVKRFRLPRGAASALVHLLAVAVILLALLIIVPSVIDQIRSLKIDFRQIQSAIEDRLSAPFVIGGQPIDLQAAAQRFGESLNSVLQTLLGEAVGLLVDLAQALVQLLLIFVVSFYLLKDGPLINQRLVAWLPASLRGDFTQLRAQIGRTWNAFFRGQLVLGVIMGVVVGVTMWALGVRNALLIGILYGVLEVVPNFGPTIATVPTLMIAYFTGSTWLPVSPEAFTLIVLIAAIALQQLENLFLVPRVMSYHLNLHPVVVLLGAIAGASLAGILGILLAAPTIATLRLIGHYAYCKLLDLEPFE